MGEEWDIHITRGHEYEYGEGGKFIAISVFNQ